MVKNQHTMGGKRKKTLKKFKKSRGGDYDNEKTIDDMKFDLDEEEIETNIQQDDYERIENARSAAHKGAKKTVDDSKKGGKRRKTLKKSRKNKKSHKSKK